MLFYRDKSRNSVFMNDSPKCNRVGEKINEKSIIADGIDVPCMFFIIV